MPKAQLPKNYFFSHAAIATSILIWSIAGPVIKLSLEDIPVYALLLFRFTLVCLIVLPYIIFALKKDPVHIQDLPGIIILGVTGQVSIVIAFLGFRYTTALDASIISIIGTILIFVVGRIFYNEKITKAESVGIVLASIGTLFVIIEPAVTHPEGVNIGQRVLGNILMFIYQLSWPIYVVLGKYFTGSKSKEVNKLFKFMKLKKLSKEYHPNTITALSFFVGLAFFIPMAVVESVTSSTTLIFSFNSIAGIIFLAVFSSIAAYGLHQWGLKYVETQETAIYSYLGPIFTLPVAYVMLGEIPSLAMLIGSSVIGMGVIIAEKYKS